MGWGLSYRFQHNSPLPNTKRGGFPHETLRKGSITGLLLLFLSFVRLNISLRSLFLNGRTTNRRTRTLSNRTLTRIGRTLISFRTLNRVYRTTNKTTLIFLRVNPRRLRSPRNRRLTPNNNRGVTSNIIGTRVTKQNLGLGPISSNTLLLRRVIPI